MNSNFCHKCGAKNEYNEKYCNFCGTEFVTTTTDLKNDKKEAVVVEKVNTRPAPTPPSKKSGCVLYLIVFALIGGMLFMITDSAPGLVGSIVGSVFTRDLTRSDYSITTSQGLSSYTFTLTPKVDIKECSISFVLYDSDGKSIYSDTISKTSLNSGSSYVYKFDYGFFDSLSASKISYDITGKV